MAIKRYCDVCEKEIDAEKYIRILMGHGPTYGMNDESGIRSEICSACAYKIKRFLKGDKNWT